MNTSRRAEPVSSSAPLLVKRALDLGFTLVASLVLLPFALVAGLLVRVTSPGPILHRATRIGRRGIPFALFKFRTMVAEAPRLGPGLTHRDDPRITAVGRILRKTKFDEFPQVINVLKGDMSIIGPRPEAPQYAEAYPKDFKSILQMRPGLTSLAQVAHRNEEQMLPAEDTEDFYLSVILPRKLSMDMYYADHWSLGLDLRVFLLGVLALLKVAPPAWLWPADVVVSLPAEDPRIMSSRN